jgi:hypothetical protein
MPKRQTLEEMVRDRYDDEDVIADVLSEIERYKTGDDILSGKCVLPHPKDALRHLERKTGVHQMTPKERSQQTMIEALQKRLDAIESQRVAPDAIRTREGV